MENEVPSGLESLVKEAQGRCHSCIKEERFDLPSGPRFYCHAYLEEMDEEQRNAVRNCPRWKAFRPYKSSLTKREQNPLIKDHLNEEDEIFWQVKFYLYQVGADLKTLLLLSQPALEENNLRWIDSLDHRFQNTQVKEVSQVVDILQNEGYHYLSQLFVKLMKRKGEEDAS